MGLSTIERIFGFDTEIKQTLPPDLDRDVLPDGLETIPTGPFLAAIVLVTDVTQLNGHDAVRYLKASARMESRFAAARLAATGRGRLLAGLGSKHRCRAYFGGTGVCICGSGGSTSSDPEKRGANG